MKKKYTFYPQKSKIQKVIKSSYHEEKEWQPDPKGYYLIRIKPEQKLIEVGLANYKHEITTKITGRYAVEIYHTLARKKLLSRFEHAAYIGKELYKAELALRYGLRYHQELPLYLVGLKEKVRLEKNS